MRSTVFRFSLAAVGLAAVATMTACTPDSAPSTTAPTASPSSSGATSSPTSSPTSASPTASATSSPTDSTTASSGATITAYGTGYRFDVPASWEAVDAPSGTDVAYRDPVAVDNFRQNVTTSIHSGQHVTDLDATAEATAKEIESGGKMSCTTAGHVTVAGEDSVSVFCTDNSSVYQTLQTFVPHGDTIYTITYTAPASKSAEDVRATTKIFLDTWAWS